MPLRIIKEKTRIDFLGTGRRRTALALSIILILASLVSIATRGLALGIDFTGGILLEAGYPQSANLDRIRALLYDTGFETAQAQRFGSDYDVIIRLPPQDDLAPNDLRERLEQTLQSDVPDVSIRRVELVGPQVGEELIERGGLSLIVTLLMVFAYIMLRFQWKFAAGAVAALVHDVIITIGYFSWFQIQFDLTVVAAVLAVIGYSLNDTVVEFDRIRENLLNQRGVEVQEVMNTSINEVLARTLITGLTTLLVLIALLAVGGEALAPFSIALVVGIVVGTYSSIYTATAIALYLRVTPQDLLPPDEISEFGDELP